MGGTVKSDGWLDALTKLIPGELIVAYAGAQQVEGVQESFVAQLTILIAFACLSPLALRWSALRAGTKPSWLQYIVRTGAFVLYGLGSSSGTGALLTEPMRWIPGVGAFVIALLAAFVLVPPGTDAES